MQFDLRLLKQAMALMESGSFSKAADALGVSQPTLSRSIKELEERVGLPLFNRDRSGIEPTDFGRVFMQHALHLLARAGDLEREVALARGLQSGEVAVGLGPYASEALAPLCAARFAAAYPSVRLRIMTDDPAVVARFLRARSVDLVVAEATVVESEEDFEIIAELAPLAGYVVVRAGHPLVGMTRVDIAGVLRYPFAQVVMLPPRVLKPILAARRSGTARGATQVPPFPAIECPTLHMAMKIVARSDAFTFATLGMVQAELERGEVVPVLHEPWMRTQWSIIRLRKRTLSPATAAFVDELKRTHSDVLRNEAVLRQFIDTPAAPTKRAQRRPAANLPRIPRHPLARTAR